MNTYALIPLVSSIAYLSLMVIVLRHRRRVHRIFALYLASVMAWSFTSFLLHAELFPGSPLIWNKFLFVIAFWSAITYYHFIRAFINRPGGLGVYLGYGILAVVIGLTATDYIIKSSSIVGGVLEWQAGPLLYLFAAIGVAIGGLAVFFLVREYRNSLNPAVRNRITYLLIGLGVMSLTGLSNLSPLAKYPVDHIGNLANALFISYAILRYQLLDIRVIVRKGLAYSILTIFVTAAYLLFLFILQMLVHAWIGYASIALAAGSVSYTHLTLPTN